MDPKKEVSYERIKVFKTTDQNEPVGAMGSSESQHLPSDQAAFQKYSPPCDTEFKERTTSNVRYQTFRLARDTVRSNHGICAESMRNHGILTGAQSVSEYACSSTRDESKVVEINYRSMDKIRRFFIRQGQQTFENGKDHNHRFTGDSVARSVQIVGTELNREDNREDAKKYENPHMGMKQTTVCPESSLSIKDCNPELRRNFYVSFVGEECPKSAQRKSAKCILKEQYFVGLTAQREFQSAESVLSMEHPCRPRSIRNAGKLLKIADLCRYSSEYSRLPPVQQSAMNEAELKELRRTGDTAEWMRIKLRGISDIHVLRNPLRFSLYLFPVIIP